MNIATGPASSRPQWSGASPRSVISVLERAKTQDDTMSSTTDSIVDIERLDISLQCTARALDSDQKNGTFDLTLIDTRASDHSAPHLPMPFDLTLENMESTFMSSSKLCDSKK